jgi:hypothetical protein
MSPSEETVIYRDKHEDIGLKGIDERLLTACWSVPIWIKLTMSVKKFVCQCILYS